MKSIIELIMARFGYIKKRDADASLELTRRRFYAEINEYHKALREAGTHSERQWCDECGHNKHQGVCGVMDDGIHPCRCDQTSEKEAKKMYKLCKEHVGEIGKLAEYLELGAEIRVTRGTPNTCDLCSSERHL